MTEGFIDTDRYCDVVMKGGVTSGVLYPPAVCELAHRYNFKHVGGTSAGAIAAALVAAAEYRRRSGGEEGFRELEEIPKAIGGPGALFSLFRPDAATRWLFRSILRIARPKTTVGKFLAALVRAPLLLLPPWYVGRIVGNGFGLSSGMANGNRRPGDPLPPLTEWLADRIDAIAGKSPDEPLTFGDLWSAPAPAWDAEGGRGAGRSIDLRVVTTALSHNRPYVLPFENELFSFEPDEFRELFPERIVTWMIQNQRRSDRADAMAEQGRLPLPLGRDLPVVVAMRMSLSFPGLFSMVPLYAVDYEREAPEDRPVWFSDGGITSNFPIQFFDSFSPRWPTFGINLRYTGPTGEPARRNVRANGIYVPETMNDGVRDLWNAFDERTGGLRRLFAFAEAILTSALDWHDNSFLRLPGYRDRVVEIWLKPNEGGLNLNMPGPVLEALEARGREAGRVLRERFTEPPSPGADISWDGHRWTRFRSSMAALAKSLQELRRGWSAPLSGDRSMKELLARGEEEPPKNYRLSSGQTEAVLGAVEALEEALAGWESSYPCPEEKDHGPFCRPPRPLIEIGTRAPL